ncbi:MAG: 6-carboxytetrahydropterin synthase [Bacteroidetes bacterium]|nr:MAG: 6-carboxytetrahydropterin synthase [Bacteroidota bacterium]
MKIAKRFRWEGAHRLPWHDGLCKNLHGHSYTMFVEVEGEPDERGLLMDFKDLKMCLTELVDAWDHGTIIDQNDSDLLDVMQSKSWKHYVIPYDTTAENMCIYAADYLIEHSGQVLLDHHIHTVRVRISETETCYAEAERRVGG